MHQTYLWAWVEEVEAVEAASACQRVGRKKLRHRDKEVWHFLGAVLPPRYSLLARQRLVLQQPPPQTLLFYLSTFPHKQVFKVSRLKFDVVWVIARGVGLTTAMSAPKMEPPKVAPLEQPSFFSGFRDEGFPSIYAELKTAAHVDVLEAGLIVAFVIIGFSLLLTLPGGTRGLQKLKVLLRICVLVVIGAILTVTNFGQEWEVGHVVSKTPYKPLISDEVDANIHLHIGLRSINVTMKAEHGLPEALKNEIIDYNEQFSWTWDQGRFGFGPFAQRKGLPLPILWIVDYFTLDGEGFRFGRFYRTAGWYTHIAMWSALPAWMLACILLHCSVHYGSLLTCLTGVLQLLACIIWASVRNPHRLFIPFEDANLTVSFGRDFWLTLINGVVCTVLGLILFILDSERLRLHEETSAFFGIDPLTIYDENYITEDEEKKLQQKQDGHDKNDTHQMELGQMDPEPGPSRYLGMPDTHVVLTRRGTLLKGQSSIRAPRLPPRPRRRAPEVIEEQPIYGNVENIGLTTAMSAPKMEPPKVAPLEQPSFFSGFRDEGFPSIYAELKTAAHVDVLEAGLIVAFVIIGFSLLLTLPGGTRGLQKLKVLLRICVLVVIGAILTVTNFGQEWEVGHVVSKTPYKPLISDEVDANIHLHIGLRSINVTMKAEHGLPEALKNEIIDYNEQFSWTWDQGRFGFGPFAQRKGLPLPILWIVDYFTLDGEGFRFGRFYRTAGWYTHIAMWSALPAWMLACILLHCSVHYGSLLTCLTGVLQLLACIIWASVRNPHRLFIPFEDANLTVSFGRDFWLTLINGVVCTVLGLILFILDSERLRLHEETSAFFGIDPLTIYDENYITEDEEKKLQQKQDGHDKNDTHQMELGQMDPEPGPSRYLGMPDTHVVLTRRGTLLKGQSSIRAPRLPPRPRRRAPEVIEEQPIYGNVENIRSDTAYVNQGFQRR
ncbi:hypothetical protein B566_EDAN008232 [Ephemera danica]|nr:hypothetical protein B566_EDAN008232 [Ephemera danica]